MKKDRICKYCNAKFENAEGRIFSNHVRWCPANTTNGDKGSAAIKSADQKRRDSEYGPVTKFTPECNFCKTPVEVFERQLQFPKRLKYFCSRRCANTHLRSEESKQLSRESALRAHRRLGTKRSLRTAKCEFCGSQTKSLYYNRKYCNRACQNAEFMKTHPGYQDSLKRYRLLCRFQFDLKQFPNEFDFELIRKHGWYSPTNRANNLNGVSRDHMVSVRFGFDNNIDPKIIAHPANCRLVQHNDNSSKHSKCSITLDDLLQRIEEWDAKYQ